MNVKQLIEKYKKLEGVWNAEGAEIARRIFLLDLYQLDEPEKVKVPQFVADWYEENKDDLEFNIFDYVYRLDQNAGFDFKDWFDDFNTKPFQTLINMHQFGYEVEEEKRYVVTLKNRQPLVKSQSGSILYFSQDITAGNYKVTRKELEQDGFGWVFDCEGIEIEEVTE